MSERPAVQAMLAEREPDRLVRMWVEMLLDVGFRTTELATVVLAAADVDADARALRDTTRQEGLAGATAFVTRLAAVGGLRADLSSERAADACWALVNSMLLHLLVASRGWSRQEYGQWLVRLASTTLLEPAVLQRSGPTFTVQIEQTEPGRYQGLVGGQAAGHLSYERTAGLMVLARTEIDPAFDACGVADALVRRALDNLRADDAQVVPLCHYAAWWIDRHPEYSSLVYDPRSV